jgi:hypothetical protein
MAEKARKIRLKADGAYRNVPMPDARRVRAKVQHHQKTTSQEYHQTSPMQVARK